MRWVKRVVLFLLLLVLGVTAYGVYTVRNSFPQVRGELELAGLDSTVEVLRDDLGVPHIYASTEHDLFFAQGYTHAQDRFWQMDVWRHIGAGRLSEMFGDTSVDTDKFLRSLGWERIAEQEWETLGSPTREVLQAYADGVNAYLDTHSGSEMSLEYAILPLQNRSYRIEPWTPVNTLTWGKVMAWDLRNNMDEEIARAILGQDLTLQQIADLYPPFPDDKPVIVEGRPTAASSATSVSLPDAAVAALESVSAAVESLPGLGGAAREGIGSNNWVVSGELTASGMPLLANDTHLAIQMPSIWYENALHCTGDTADCPYDLIGYSFAGTPGIVTGHNGHHAWGVTNQAADTQDLFIERVHPDDPLLYEIDGEWVPFQVRTETIEVGGGDQVTYDVLISRHGPIISGTYLDEGVFDGSTAMETPDRYAVALSWRALQPSTLVEAIIGINRARDYEEFREAVGLWDTVPQNVVYADVEGNIAYHATGEIPLRANGDGSFPVPGWDSEYEWTGFVGTADKPSVLNPAEGFIQSANQQVTRSGDLLIGRDGAYGYRGGRIVEMIEDNGPHTVETMQQIQLDEKDVGAVNVVPYLLALDPGENEDVASMQTFLEGWATGARAYQAEYRSSGAAIYMVVWGHILAATFRDELPEDYWPSGGSRWFEVVRTLLDSPEDPWWDDVSTSGRETRDDILLRALGAAHAELSGLQGEDPASWTWGELHIGHFENQTLGQSGIAPVEWLFNRTAPPRLGSSASIVNAVSWNTAAGSYEVDWLPSQRMVVDLADLDSSQFIHTTGQSGHAFAANYGSMIEMWTDGEYGPMPFSRGAVEAVAVDTLTLIPPG